MPAALLARRGIASPLPLSAYDALVLATPGLRSYWPLDDSAGAATARDLGPAANNLVRSDGVFGVAGKVATAFDTNGGLGRLDGGLNYDFAGQAPFTAEVLLRPTALGGSGGPNGSYKHLLSRFSGNPDDVGWAGWSLFTDYASSNRLYICRGNGTGGQSRNTGAGALTLNAWHLLHFTYSPANGMRLYKNGVLQGITGGGYGSFDQNIPASGSLPQFCASGRDTPAGMVSVSGAFDCAAVYAAELSASDIAARATLLGL